MANTPRSPRTFRLTTEIIAASVGSGVTCLALAGIGRTYPLYARRPGPELNTRVSASRSRVRLDLPSGAAHVIKPEPAKPSLIRVEVMGPIEQRAGYHDPCAGWSDGHDAICERLCAAFEEGDVLFVIDSPGGAAAGIQQAVERAQKAKAAAGRHVTVFAQEMIGSAACWWACALGDEIYVPPSGQIGSIGARGEHTSVAAALAQAGVEKTYFTWPDDGKVAFAPERPLSEEGRARGSRDANIAGEMFCAAVVAARGISREDVMAMHADMFTGDDAVKRGLADGVASEDDVIAYALKRAEGGGESETSTRSARVRARGDRAMPKTRTEDEEERARSEEDDMPPPSSKPMPGKEPDGKCADCGSQNEENAKFCDQCGASLAARPMEADRSEERQQPPAPDRMSTSSLNAILGVPEGASLPVQKAAALDLRSVYDHAAKLTGEKSAGRVRGALSALAKDAAEGARANRELRELRERSDAKERLQLAHRFVKLGDPRERVYRLDADGKVAGLKSYYANAPLDELRGEVEAREKAQPAASPFREDRERAETAAKEAGATGSTMTLEAAKKNPRVLALFNEAKGRGSKQTLDDVANEWLKAAAGGA